MPSREYVAKGTPGRRRHREDAEPVESGQDRVASDTIVDDIDDLLEEIDAVLEEQTVLMNFRQRSGE